MIKSDYEDKIETPKEVAKRICRIALNTISIDGELDCYPNLTELERKEIHRQFHLVGNRIFAKYLQDRKDKK